MRVSLLNMWQRAMVGPFTLSLGGNMVTRTWLPGRCFTPFLTCFALVFVKAFYITVPQSSCAAPPKNRCFNEAPVLVPPVIMSSLEALPLTWRINFMVGLPGLQAGLLPRRYVTVPINAFAQPLYLGRIITLVAPLIITILLLLQITPTGRLLGTTLPLHPGWLSRTMTLLSGPIPQSSPIVCLPIKTKLRLVVCRNWPCEAPFFTRLTRNPLTCTGSRLVLVCRWRRLHMEAFLLLGLLVLHPLPHLLLPTRERPK